MTPVELLQILIRNRCVNDGSVGSGGEARSVGTLVDFFGEAGEIFEPAPGRQSLVYRVAGTDPGAPSLALVPHLDVVPVDADGWTVDPFAAEIHEGNVYGRGAIDMLNVTAAMAASFRPYLTGERVSRGDLIFCAVADEENGGRFGARFLVDEHWPLVAADYLLTEVAYPGLGPNGTIPVATTEKGTYWTVLESRGSPGHGSAPYRADNALAKMVSALAGIFAAEPPRRLGDDWPFLVRALDMPGLADAEGLEEAIEGVAAVDAGLARYLHAVTHLTVSPNLAQAGTKTNIIADRARAELDIRALPGMDRATVDEFLLSAMGGAADEVSSTPVMDHPATTSPARGPLWEAVENAVESLEGHRRLIPVTMPVATDARFWRSRGTVAYGVGLYPPDASFSEMQRLFHGHDERVSVESVTRTTGLYKAVLAAFG